MACMKEVYIIIRKSGKGILQIEKKFGTREEIQDYISKMIYVDAKNDKANYINGTNNVYELKYIGNVNGMYWYNLFFDYEIDYYAFSVNDIPMAKED